MTQAAATAPDAASDPRIDPRVRTFLADLNKDSSPFWELPGSQVRAILTGLQAKTPVDLSGVTIAEKTIKEDGRNSFTLLSRKRRSAPCPSSCSSTAASGSPAIPRTTSALHG
jgi:hypothetical protein